MYERFTDRSRKVMQLANQEAQRFNHEYIAAEHILIGLLKEGSGAAAVVLKNLGVDIARARREVEKVIQPGPDRIIMGRLPHTPSARRVVEGAIEESGLLGHNYVGTEHLLLSILRDQESTAMRVLTNLGIDREKVIADIRKLLKPEPHNPLGELPVALLCVHLLTRDQWSRIQAILAEDHKQPFPRPLSDADAARLDAAYKPPSTGEPTKEASWRDRPSQL